MNNVEVTERRTMCDGDDERPETSAFLPTLVLLSSHLWHVKWPKSLTISQCYHFQH